MRWEELKWEVVQVLNCFAFRELGEAAKRIGRLIVRIRRLKRQGALEGWRADWVLQELHDAQRWLRRGGEDIALMHTQAANRLIWQYLRGEL
jgi:hypothetical protein